MNTRRGLGRGLGALIPTAAEQEARSGTASAAATGVGHAATPRTAAQQPAQDNGAAGGSHRSGASPERAHDAERADATTMAPAAAEVQGATFAELRVDRIRPNPRQPREIFEEEAMAELVHSIREIGLLQPVVVRPLGDDRYELIMGERRWRATHEAGLETIPAIVRDTSDDAMLRDALLENLHRAELNPLEEAAAYQQLLDDFGCTHDDLAARIGRSRPQISNTLRLLRLSPPVQRRIAAGVLSAGHARALVGVQEEVTQDRLAGRVVAEGLSVRALEEIISVGENGDGARRRPRGNKPVAPGLTELSDRLSERFETRVKVDLGRAKGRITVEFASLEDLQRIVELMDPQNDVSL